MSGLSIGTGTAVLGTHTMEVTVYRRQGSESYMPIGHSSLAFTITGKDLGRERPTLWEEKKVERLGWTGRGKGKWCVILKGQNQENLGKEIWGLEPVKGQSAWSWRVWP